MFQDVGGLHSELLAKDPSDFVSYYLLECVPFVFGNDWGAWISWKTILGGLIEVDPRDIVLVGSAALGFSLSPEKNFSAYHAASDIDVGVVSPYHFDVAWRYLRQQRTSWLTANRKTKNAIQAHRRNYVFSGTIATDQMLAILPFGPNWQAAVDLMAETDPTKQRAIKLRIYRDFDALRSYQAFNIRSLQAVVATPIDEEPIGEDE